MAAKTNLSGLEECPLHRKTPFGVMSVSLTQFSIARYYGGIVFNGENYTYFPETDELVRNDVLKWRKKERKNAKKLRETENKAVEQGDFLEGFGDDVAAPKNLTK